jgi:hypothetical protein
LYREKNMLVESHARLVPKSPLFIRGPSCGKGQVIVILQLK